VSDPPPVDDSEMTVFTEKDSSGCINYRQGRPALLVSSTSWTGQFSIDRDFLAYIFIIACFWLHAVCCWLVMCKNHFLFRFSLFLHNLTEFHNICEVNAENFVNNYGSIVKKFQVFF